MIKSIDRRNINANEYIEKEDKTYLNAAYRSYHLYTYACVYLAVKYLRENISTFTQTYVKSINSSF